MNVFVSNELLKLTLLGYSVKYHEMECNYRLNIE